LKCVPKLGRTPVGESLEMAFQAEWVTLGEKKYGCKVRGMPGKKQQFS
jgi:hypothetical protein